MTIYQFNAALRRSSLTVILACLAACSAPTHDVGSTGQGIGSGGAPDPGLVTNVKILHNVQGEPICSALLLPDGVRVLTAAHCVDDQTIYSKTGPLGESVLGNRPLSVNSVTSRFGDMIVAGTVGPKVETQKPQAFVTIPGTEPLVATGAVANGIKAITTSPFGLVAAGWVGETGNEEAVLMFPKQDVSGRLYTFGDSALLIPGRATAVVAFDSPAGSRVIVAGEARVGRLARTFVQETDGAGGLVNEWVAPTDPELTNFITTGLARGSDGSVWLAGNQRGHAKLINISPTDDRTTHDLATFSKNSSGSRAVTVDPNGVVWTLVDVDGTAKLFKLHNSLSTEFDLSFEDHYLFNDGTTKYGGFAAKALAVDASNRVVVVGQVHSKNGTRQAALQRLTPSGVLDTAFGANGMLLHEPKNGVANFKAVAIDGDKIHVAGRSVTRRIIHQLTSHTFAATRAGALRGILSIGTREVIEEPFVLERTIDMSSIVLHEKYDLATAQLSSPLATSNPLSYLTPVSDIPAKKEVKCIGMGVVGDAPKLTAVLTQGLFTIDKIYPTVLALKPSTTASVEFGDSGGPCFSAPNTLAGLMIQTWTDTFTKAVDHIIVRPDDIKTFVSEN